METLVDLNMSPTSRVASERTQLIVLARYCIARIARELAGIEDWTVRLAPRAGQVTATVRARVRDVVVEACGSDVHPASAIWNAMCRIEQPLREAARGGQRYVTASTLLPSGSSTNAA